MPSKLIAALLAALLLRTPKRLASLVANTALVLADLTFDAGMPLGIKLNKMPPFRVTEIKEGMQMQRLCQLKKLQAKGRPEASHDETEVRGCILLRSLLYLL